MDMRATAKSGHRLRVGASPVAALSCALALLAAPAPQMQARAVGSINAGQYGATIESAGNFELITAEQKPSVLTESPRQSESPVNPIATHRLVTLHMVAILTRLIIHVSAPGWHTMVAFQAAATIPDGELIPAVPQMNFYRQDCRTHGQEQFFIMGHYAPAPPYQAQF